MSRVWRTGKARVIMWGLLLLNLLMLASCRANAGNFFDVY